MSDPKLQRLVVKVDAKTPEEYRARLYADRAADLAAGGATDTLTPDEIEAWVASREQSLDLAVRLAADLDDGRRIENVFETHSTHAFLFARAPGEEVQYDELDGHFLKHMTSDLLDVDEDALDALASAVRSHGIRITVAELTAAPRELEVTERARDSIRKGVARDVSDP